METSSSCQILNETQTSLERALQQRVFYISSASWVGASSSHSYVPRVVKCVIILSETGVHVFDEKFLINFTTIKYSLIARVLVDPKHKLCFSLHLDVSQSSEIELMQA